MSTNKELTAMERVAKTIEVVNFYEKQIRREVCADFYPQLPGLCEKVVERLRTVQKAYRNILEQLEGVRKLYPKQQRANIERKIEVARQAMDDTGKSVEAIDGIRCGMEKQPFCFFVPEKKKEVKQHV